MAEKPPFIEITVLPVRNRGYYAGIPITIQFTLETGTQAFRELQEGNADKAIAFALLGIASFFFARKLLNRFHRLENSQ